ncbi:hypothetical protein B0F90DRAFT_1710272 [Multifurca ochricompacta]|uniref:Uncharacterized protein n=1 Tax=Multifurca ochricompacta TaxID=376703 RepID=A0AAD4QN98_9AGAM|nr:hypothetical protein B0F90DRAFT_1710272 [Multifurca ochricompacta]
MREQTYHEEEHDLLVRFHQQRGITFYSYERFGLPWYQEHVRYTRVKQRSAGVSKCRSRCERKII